MLIRTVWKKGGRKTIHSALALPLVVRGRGADSQVRHTGKDWTEGELVALEPRKSGVTC